MIAARIAMASIWGIICIMIASAPYLAQRNLQAESSVLYCLFSLICHQMPDRSFGLWGHKLAVCHRCAGIYLGLFVGALLLINVNQNVKSRRNWALVACAPICADFFSGCLGFWHGFTIIRFVTGLLFGMIASSLLVQGIAELITEAAPGIRLALTKIR
jgi:uncharacterized membrane protein